jgi:hypothetical protein
MEKVIIMLLKLSYKFQILQKYKYYDNTTTTIIQILQHHQYYKTKILLETGTGC